MIKSGHKQEHSNIPDILYSLDILYEYEYDFQLRLQILRALFLIKSSEAWWQLETRKCSGAGDPISVMRSMVMESSNHWALFYGSSFLIRTSNKSPKQPWGGLELPWTWEFEDDNIFSQNICVIYTLVTLCLTLKPHLRL